MLEQVPWDFLCSSLAPETGHGWQCHQVRAHGAWTGTYQGLRLHFSPSEPFSDLYPECGASLTPRAAGGLMPVWSLRGPVSGLLPQEGSLASRGSPQADAPFPLQQSVRPSCQRGAHVLIRSDSHCLLFFCFFLHLVLCFNACCNFY